MVIGLTSLAAVQVNAGPPDPANSSCPVNFGGNPYVIVSPNGSCCFDVIVRDAIGSPVVGSTVVVDFGCPVAFCPAQLPGHTIIGNTVSVVTDATGLARFCICATVTLPCTATIRADGVLLCNAEVATSECAPTPNRISCWGRLKVLYR